MKNNTPNAIAKEAALLLGKQPDRETPEGVPENAEYIAPGEPIPEGYSEVEGPEGATWAVEGGAQGETAETPEEQEVTVDNFFGEAVGLQGRKLQTVTSEFETFALEHNLTEEARQEFEQQYIESVMADAENAGMELSDFDTDAFVGYANQMMENFIEERSSGRYGTLDDEYRRDLWEESPVDREEFENMDTSEELRDSFEIGVDQLGLRELGITGGNTKGSEIEVVRMPDGSRNFATPVEAYKQTGPADVVSSPDEAILNNTNAPKVIEAVGGDGASCEVARDEDGNQYLVKEGIDGRTYEEEQLEGEGIAYEEKAARTLAAGWFVGNQDLHHENLMVDEEGKLVIIDHDSAGAGRSSGRSEDWNPVTSHPSVPTIDDSEVEEQIYEVAIGFETGEIDKPFVKPEFRRYIDQATEQALTAANQNGYEGLPEELRTDDFGDIDTEIGDFSEGDELAAWDDIMRQRVEGEVVDVNTEDGWIAIWDEQGNEHIIDGVDEIEEVL